MKGIETVIQEVKQIRTAAQHEMLLAEDSEREEVVAYLLDLKAQVDAQVAEAARIHKYQALFKVCVCRSHDQGSCLMGEGSSGDIFL